MKAVIETEAPVSVDIVEAYGAVTGYVVPTKQEQLPNWLSKHGFLDENLVIQLRFKFENIAILNNLDVFLEDDRDQGNGKHLFSEFEYQAKLEEANGILLLADTAETNDFDLVAWYKRLGFQTIATSQSGPLMILPIER